MTTMEEEQPNFYVMRDGETTFRVPKAGLSETLHSRIRAMRPQNKAGGGPIYDLNPDGSYVRIPEPEGIGMSTLRGIGRTLLPGVVGPAPGPEWHAAPPPRTQGIEVKRDTAPAVVMDESTEVRPPEAQAMDGVVDALRTAPPTEPVAQKNVATPKTMGSTPKAATPNVPDGYELERRGLQQEAEAKAAQGRGEADALAAYQTQLEKNAVQREEIHARAAEQAQKSLADIQASRDNLKKQDVSIDSGRWWASRSTPGKISAVIGLVLGAVGAGNDGVNRAVGLINQSIDRDLEAQKTEHTFKMKQGAADLEAAQSIYGLHRQQLQDDLSANLVAKGTALDLAKNQVDLAAARAADPMAKANLLKLSGNLEQQKQQSDAQAKQRAFDNSIKRQHADVERMEAQARMDAARVPKGADAKQNELAANIETENRTIQERGEKLKGLIRKYGTGELTGPAEAEMRQAVTDMATAAAKLKDPTSVARSSEVEAEAKNIFKPGFLQKGDTAIKVIDSYLQNAEQRRNDAFRVRGIQTGGGEATEPKRHIAQNEKGEKVEWNGSAWVPLK